MERRVGRSRTGSRGRVMFTQMNKNIGKGCVNYEPLFPSHFPSSLDTLGPIHKETFPLENPLENWCEISYSRKSPKIGSLDMSYNQNQNGISSGNFSL